MTAASTHSAIYENKRFTVTASHLRTPSTFYPISETVGRVRRDFLFFGLAFALLVGFALWRYFDLWYDYERIAMGGAIVLSLVIGSQLSILQIDAKGFPSQMYFARTKTIRAVFKAITEAKADSMQSNSLYEMNETESNQEI